MSFPHPPSGIISQASRDHFLRTCIDWTGLNTERARSLYANLQAITIKIIQYPIFCLVFQIMPEIMPWQESVASTPYYKNFMGIFKKIKRIIATWLLDTDPESEDVDHEENQSAASPSPGDTLPTAVPSLDRIVPTYSHETEWTVKYWRGNRPSPDSPHTPGGYSQVQESHLIDALWHNRSERRQIHLGRFLCTYEVRDKEDPKEFLVNPRSLEFNSEVKKALRPHKQILVDLVDSPNEVDDAIVPAKRIAEVAEKAASDGNPKPDAADVDMEALILLEMRMFDRSEDAGIAGNYHCDGPEGEKQVGPEFDTEELAQWHRAKLKKEEEKKRGDEVTWPKPRMLSRCTGKCRALDDIPAEPSAVRPGSPNKDTALLPAKRSHRKLMDNTDPDWQTKEKPCS
ncbi:hypothetical protein ARMSODRAFT_975857 [Armillaria solidipes]|uniref:Uncharacterized protein n=1 Tax=Armillaria solidipes TaxID=1076256 RepID=A0A2H3BC52_9AGAR|nr:hypothetical protein ARMSODRAFT_975857 [Armillaria solidipes]